MRTRFISLPLLTLAAYAVIEIPNYNPANSISVPNPTSEDQEKVQGCLRGAWWAYQDKAVIQPTADAIRVKLEELHRPMTVDNYENLIPRLDAQLFGLSYPLDVPYPYYVSFGHEVTLASSKEEEALKTKELKTRLWNDSRLTQHINFAPVKLKKVGASFQLRIGNGEFHPPKTAAQQMLVRQVGECWELAYPTTKPLIATNSPPGTQ